MTSSAPGDVGYKDTPSVMCIMEWNPGGQISPRDSAVSLSQVMVVVFLIVHFNML